MGRKVRLLARSWPLLRELSPQQRERVALAVGSGWASRNLEGMFGHPEEQSDNQRQVKAIFERMRDADPNELRRLGKEMKKGGVSQAKSRLLGALEEALDEKVATEQHSESPGPGAAGGDRAADAAREVPAPPPPPPWLPGNMLEELDESEAPYRSRAREPVAAVAAVTRPTLIKETEGSDSGQPRPQPRPGASKNAADTTSKAPPPALARTKPEIEEPSSKSPITSEAAAGTSGSRGPSDETDQSKTSVGPALVRDDPADSQRREAVTLSAVESLRTLRRLSGGKVASSRTSRAALVGSLG